MYRVYHSPRLFQTFATRKAAERHVDAYERRTGIVLVIVQITPSPIDALRHHVTGAIQRGEAVPVVCQPIPFRESECGGAFDGVIVSSDADSGL